mmetsp:Transcript_40156/g.60263  ORF Transcript_40156/g.60263 Transcript_40156/m.60263 type:complete len:206 (-) Transcript_40156:317-934(-)
MMTVSPTSCSAFFLLLFINRTPFCDCTNYGLIDSYDQDLCWRVDGAGSLQVGDKIVLAECENGDDRQLFEINNYGYGCGGRCDDAIVVEFRPKLNTNLVIGVNALVTKKRLRVQNPSSDDNSTQVFYYDEHGKLGINITDEFCMQEFHEDEVDVFGHCLLVTNQGNYAEVGDIVHIRTFEEVFSKPNSILNWLRSVLAPDDDDYY